MPKSGYWTQKCKCGSDQRAAVSISIGASTLGKNPRRKSRTITIYICAGCLKEPSRKTRMHMVRSIREAAHQIPAEEKSPRINHHNIKTIRSKRRRK